MTPKVNHNPHNNPPNPVPNVPADLDSDPSLSYSSSSYSSDSSDDEYYKQRRRAKKGKNKRHGKTRLYDPIKKCTKLKSRPLTAAYKSKVVKFNLYEDPLQRYVSFLSLMNSL